MPYNMPYCDIQTKIKTTETKTWRSDLYTTSYEMALVYSAASGLARGFVHCAKHF